MISQFNNVDRKDVISVTDKMVDDRLHDLLEIVRTLVYKDAKEAMASETIESAKNADFYIMALEETDTFLIHNYERWIYEAAGVPADIIDECIVDKTLTPPEYHNFMLKTKRTEIIENYIELNSYYRELNGIPDVGDEGIYVDDKIPGVPNNIPIHQFNKLQIEIITNNGILDMYRSMYPEAKYLNYLGDRSIPIYNSRTAPEFGLLYLTAPEETLKDKFKMVYNNVRMMVIHTLYNTAFEEQKFYDKFIAMVIGVITIQQMVVQYINVGVKRDFSDPTAINFIFQSYGVDTFEDLPMVYRKKLMKNLIPLLKYKGTDTIIKEVYKLFGVSDVDVSKYYIIKTHKLTQNGEFIFAEKNVDDGNGNITTVPDYDKMYDVGFVKIKMDETNVDNAIKNTPIDSYESVVSSDRYWGGDSTKDAVKENLLQQSFNYTESKYIGINNTYNLTEILFELNYFFKTVIDLKENYASSLSLQIPSISTTYKIDLFTACMVLFALVSNKYGSNGDIPNEITVNAKILGFNFESDIDKLNEFIVNNGFDPNTVHKGGLKYPNGFINTPAQIIDIFFHNKSIYNHISNVLETTDDYEEYSVYKKVFDILMLSENNLSIYKKHDGSIATSYMDLLSDQPLIYSFLLDIFKESDVERHRAIDFLITEILQSLNAYIESDKFKYLFMNIPSLTGSLFRKYIQRVIDFFKSYTVEIITVSNLYVFEEKSDNTIRLLDKRSLGSPKKMQYLDQLYRDCMDRVGGKTSKMIRDQNIIIKDALTIYYNYKGGNTNV